MTAPALQRQPGPDRLRTPAPPAAPSGRFSWRVVAACGWVLGGLFVDGWFHHP